MGKGGGGGEGSGRRKSGAGVLAKLNFQRGLKKSFYSEPETIKI